MGGRLLLSKCYVPEDRAARERPPLRGNFHCSGGGDYGVMTDSSEKSFLGCRTGAAGSRPQAPESRPYRAFHCCGLRLGTSAREDGSKKQHTTPTALLIFILNRGLSDAGFDQAIRVLRVISGRLAQLPSRCRHS